MLYIHDIDMVYINDRGFKSHLQIAHCFKAKSIDFNCHKGMT